jgi:hypothetical protein
MGLTLDFFDADMTGLVTGDEVLDPGVLLVFGAM